MKLLFLGYKKYEDSYSIYRVEQGPMKVDLFFSKIDNNWSVPGKKAYSLKNNGNGFEFKDHKTNKKIKIDFCQAEALRALLKLQDENGSTFDLVEISN